MNALITYTKWMRIKDGENMLYVHIIFKHNLMMSNLFLFTFIRQTYSLPIRYR